MPAPAAGANPCVLPARNSGPTVVNDILTSHLSRKD